MNRLMVLLWGTMFFVGTLFADPIATTLNFDLNGGTFNGLINTKIVYDGEPYGILPVPRHEEFYFMGWQTCEGAKITAESIRAITDGNTLVATWSIEPFAAVDLGDISNYHATKWRVNGDAFDSGDYSYGSTGTSSLSIEIMCYSPSIISYEWRFDGENSFAFYIDGVRQIHTTDGFGWQNKKYQLSAGTHTLEWVYSKNHYYSYSYSAAWLRGIKLIPNDYAYVVENDEITLIGINGEVENLVIPEKIDGCKVTKIAQKAFEGNVGVKSITVPSTIEVIGTEAFRDCGNATFYFNGLPIKKVEENAFPNGVAYYDSKLSHEWDNKVNDGTWNGLKLFPCSPSSVFDYWIANKTISIAGLIDSSYTKLFIPQEIAGYPVTSIGESAFYNCTKLTSVTIPEGVTTIGNKAFQSCNSLTSMTIPSSVTSIGDYAFYYCSSLTSVTIPSSVTSIGLYAFEGVSPIELTARWLPSGMSMSKLKTLVIPEGTTSFTTTSFTNCTKLTSVTIPASVTSIGSSAFTGCSALKKVVFFGAPLETGLDSSTFGSVRFYYPTGTAELLDAWTAKFESLTPWGTTEFVGYNRQQDGLLFQASGGSATVVGTYEKMPYAMVVPERIGNRYAVKTIVDKAFMTQESMVSLQLPKSVTTINNGAFKDCAALKAVEFMGTPPTTVADDAFVSAQGYYWPEMTSAWASVVDANGLWKNLTFDVLNAHADGWLYQEATDGIKVVRADTTFSGQLVIPELINGKSVTTIAPDAFVGQDGITEIVIPEGVTTIGDRAFEGCTAVTRVQLPSTLATVGDRAFTGVAPETLVAAWLPKGMSSERLLHLTIPTGVTKIPVAAFTNASKIETLIFPVGVTSVASDAFSGVSPKVLTSWFIPSNMTRSKIEELTIPEGVTSLASNAFENCTSLKTVDFPSTLKTIGSYAFNGCTLWEDELVLPTGVTSIGEYAFYNCSSLKGVLVIPTGVTTISSYAFYGCSGLTGLTLHDAITTVGTYAFYGCTSITGTISIPRTATVNSSAFTNVAPSKLTAVALLGGMLGTNIEEIVVPEGTTTVSAPAFSGCSKAARVFLPASVTSVGTNAFKNVAPTILQAPFLPSGMSKTSVVTLALPQGMTEVIDSAFAYCSNVDAVVIPEGVTKIGKSSFYGCESMKTLKLAESVETIGNQAFCGCSALEGLTIPSQVKTIGAYAFSLCSAVTQVYFEGLPPTIPNGAFAFDDFGDVPTEGYYLESLQDAWTDVIDEGWWDNLYMSTYTSGGAGSGSGGTGGGVMPDEETPVARYAVKVNVVGSGSVAGAGRYAAGDIVTLTATAGDGTIFCGWNEPTAQFATYTFVMPEANMDVCAYFADATTLETYVKTNELLTREELQKLALSMPVIEVKEGVATVRVQILKASTLNGEWESVENGEVAVEIVPKADEKAAFYKFVVPNKQ